MTSEYLWLAAQNLLSPGIGILMEGEGESGAAAQTNSVGDFFTALGKIVTEFRTGFGNIFGAKDTAATAYDTYAAYDA